MVPAKKRAPKKWSQQVTRESRALVLDEGVFTWKDPVRIARSLKKSADASNRRRGTPYSSAMSMLTFYVNRAGANLDKRQKRILEQAKLELRNLYRKDL